jgi:F-type H+-transporting ATPase subunit delta
MATAPEQVVEGYARALVLVAHVEGVLDRVSDELFTFARALDTDEQLRERLEDQRLEPSTRLEIVDELLGAAHPQTRAAASWLVHAGRVRQLAAVADQVAELAAQSQGANVARVRSAVPLDEGQRERLARALSRALDRQVAVKVVVDPDVVGGLVVTVGDTVIDGSLSTRLADMRAALSGAA